MILQYAHFLDEQQLRKSVRPGPQAVEAGYTHTIHWDIYTTINVPSISEQFLAATIDLPVELGSNAQDSFNMRNALL